MISVYCGSTVRALAVLLSMPLIVVQANLDNKKREKPPGG